MRRYPDCERPAEDTSGLFSTLTPDDGVTVLLHSLFNDLNRMQRLDVLQMRAEIAKRFGGRYCRNDTCAMMIELIDAHLHAASGAATQSAPPSSEPPSFSKAGRISSGLQPDRIATSTRLPAPDDVVILYSENTGPHQGIYSASGIWLDMFGQVVNRVTHWWPLPVEQADEPDFRQSA